MAKATTNPIVLVVGGPNGAGKSTAAATVFGEEARANEFLNADVIARGLAAFEPERAAFAAGRVMLTRIKQLVAARSSFSFESTLSSRTFAPLLQSAKEDGYRVHLLYVWFRRRSFRSNESLIASRAAGTTFRRPTFAAGSAGVSRISLSCTNRSRIDGWFTTTQRGSRHWLPRVVSRGANESLNRSSGKRSRRQPVPRKKNEPPRVKGLDELGAARVTRAFNRGIRESLAREAAYRRSKKKSKR